MEYTGTGLNKHVIFLGISSFPFGLANIEKTKLIAKALVITGCECSVLNRKWYVSYLNNVEFYLSAVYHKIMYYNASGQIQKPESFIKRNLLKLIMPLKEFSKIKQINSKNKITDAIVSNRNAFLILYYIIMSKLFNFKVYLTVVENAESMVTRSSISFFNDLIYKKFILKKVDGAFPISEFLINYIKRHAPKQKILKIPILCDFEKFEKDKNLKSEKYFLFCGAAAYIEIIRFILNAFNKINNKTYKLYLICNGNQKEMDILRNEILKNKKSELIRIFSGLNEEDLIDRYINAKAMLIPLRDTDQDKARFPHKIGEYLASGNPLITTAVGEINYYFQHKENALIADHYTVHEYAKLMKYVVDHSGEAEIIGKKGKVLGEKYFDYSIFGEKIVNFFNTVK